MDNVIFVPNAFIKSFMNFNAKLRSPVTKNCLWYSMNFPYFVLINFGDIL